MQISLYAQENLPTYSAVEYEIQADSLIKSNQPQDMLISISSSSGGLDAYELKIYDLKVLWTLVSAKLNDEPIWLVNDDLKSDRENVLAWEYDSEQNLLRLYPADWQSGYELELMVRLSILQPGLVKKNDAKSIALEADIGGTKYKCSSRGTGSDMTFKKKVRNTR
jgi:hypothetical protein